MGSGTSTHTPLQPAAVAAGVVQLRMQDGTSAVEVGKAAVVVVVVD